MEVKEAIRYIFEGQAILFTGAGFSLGCKNISSDPFASANELKVRIGRELGIPSVDSYTLPVLSNHFIRKCGEEKLIELLKREFKVKNIQDFHSQIINQDWKRFYTANYDDLIEFVHNKNQKKFISVTPEESADEHASKNNLIVHLNGYIEKMYPGNLRKYVKLTNESYATDTLRESKWSNLFSLDIQNAKAIFFVGFSLNYDLDISRIISSNEELKSKVFFINGHMTDSILIEDLENFGTVTDLDSEKFAKLINEEKKTYVPMEGVKENFLSFEKVVNRSNLIEVKDIDIMDLFFKGSNDEKLLQDYCEKPGYYSVIREKERQVINAVNERNINLIIIHSAFGNGKTLFVETLKYRLSKLGKTVFSYNGNITFLAEDIEKINNYNLNNKVVIIEDYYSIKSDLEKLLALDKSNVTLIVTGRSSIHFNTKFELYRNTGYLESKSTSISLDEIVEKEIEQIYKLIDSHGLWGDMAHLNTKSKKQQIRKHAQKGFSHIMFEVLKSNGMFSRLGEIYNNISFNSNKEIILAAMIVNVLRSNIQLRDILLILDKVNLSESEANEPGFKEFIDVEKNKIVLKSGVASKNLLNEYVKSDELLITLQKMFNRANSLNINMTYDYFCRELVSFSNFKMLFNGKGTNIVSAYSLQYYESIKNTTFAKRNHFFWLQYAIQKLEQKEYNLAGVYFKNAYSLAKSINTRYDTYQIDTHYARYQLEKTIDLQISPDEAIENLKNAHNKLIKSNEGLSKHYIIRQAVYYKDIFEKYQGVLDSNQRLFILKCITEMKDITFDYINSCKGNKRIEWYVDDVKRKLDSISI